MSICERAVAQTSNLACCSTHKGCSTLRPASASGLAFTANVGGKRRSIRASRGYGSRRLQVPGERSAAVRVRAAVVSEQNPVSGQFDYIIVGGGAAGCVLANRLSADASKRVLVLEAGVNHEGQQDVTIPAGLPKLFKSAFDWNIYSNKQKDLLERQVYLARGKILGGSSCTNATLYHRGTATDYDSWGVEGWRSGDVINWFIKCEDYDAGAVEGVHGVGGTMHVENPRYHNKLHDVFFSAAEQAGLKPNPDFNDWTHEQDGFGEFPVTQEKGQRADMFRQYLKPVLGRPNLQVLTGAKTLKVEFERANSGKLVGRGVTFSVNGPSGQHHAAELKTGGEVIMAAGAIHTPQLLQLSGIGPAGNLKDHGVSVLSDMASVGKNLQDHPATLTSYHIKESLGPVSLTDHIYKDGAKIRLRAILNYLVRQRGPLATTGCDHGAFLRTRAGPRHPCKPYSEKLWLAGLDQPDIQIRFVPAAALDPDGVSSYVEFARLAKTGKKYPTGFAFQVLGVRPRSRGSVSLRSDDPWDFPKVDAGFLSDPEGADLVSLRAGLKKTREMASQPAFADYLDTEMWPGSQVQSDGELDEYIRRYLHSGNAVVGSCRMGGTARDGSVVDRELRVHGVDGLRVIDASIMPRIPGGQTGAATVMVAERGAALLLGENIFATPSVTHATHQNSRCWHNPYPGGAAKH